MSNAIRIAAAAVVILMTGTSAPALAGRLYPLTECGPDLSRLCRLHGAFEATPFHYNLAIYPGCLRRVAVMTPRGLRYRHAVVCGAPERPMIW
ncbi:hypothetical protein [Bradyrhizobium sp. SZCCHNR1002]|uniref:hypothetical protein n=1 Tax=unclassified Bradyrhizobium TaxID=2631580 RepID=UPI003965716D